MASLKLLVVLAVLLTSLQFQPSTGRSTLDAVDAEDDKLDVVTDPDDCIDQTDCDPYGLYVCDGSTKDWKWSQACCREYCGYCNLPVPKNQNCDSVNGKPSEDNFKTEECLMPDAESLAPGYLIIKNLYLSLDPALRCRMNEDSGVHYMKAYQLNQPVDGLGGVGEVVASADPEFEAGDLVSATFLWPWALYFKIEKTGVRKLQKDLFSKRPSLALSLLGGTGLTAYLGMVERGHVTPDGHQTVVVSSAAGATGSIAGQVARILGAKRVVGICGTEEKCAILLKEFGFDAAISYRSDDFAGELARACPEGVHVYFDNVGGIISEIVIEQMVQNGHVVLCGQIAMYNKDVPYPPPIEARLKEILQERNITRERFLVLNHAEKFEDSLQVLAKWYQEGKIKVRETVVEGLGNTAKAFVSMMQGGNNNIGKLIVHVGANHEMC